MSKITAKTTRTITPVVYSDFFTDFSRSSSTGQLNKKTNENAVKQSIRNLLLTDFYERPFHPEIGSNLRGLLFENITPGVIPRAKKAIEEVFDLYEPRAALIRTDVIPTSDSLGLVVTIYFRIINSEGTESLDVILERTR